MKTRARIITTVIKAFNEKAYHTFSLTELAHKCKMSRGNLAYHYKDKEAILDDISMRMSRDIERFQQRRKDFPAFYNLSLDIRICRYLQEQYTFIFRDMSILEHQSIKQVMNTWSKKVLKSNLDAFSYGIKVGNVKPEPYDGLYYQLSLNAWLLTYYWVAQEAVREIGKEEAEVTVWSTIYPHFTEKGMKAFTEYYGQDFLSKSGIPIQQYIDIKHLL